MDDPEGIEFVNWCKSRFININDYSADELISDFRKYQYDQISDDIADYKEVENIVPDEKMQAAKDRMKEYVDRSYKLHCNEEFKALREKIKSMNAIQLGDEASKLLRKDLIYREGDETIYFLFDELVRSHNYLLTIYLSNQKDKQ